MLNVEDYARFLYYACRNASIEYGGEPLGINRTLSWENVPKDEQTFYRAVAAHTLNYLVIGIVERFSQITKELMRS